MYFRTRVQIPAPPFITPFGGAPFTFPASLRARPSPSLAHCAHFVRYVLSVTKRRAPFTFPPHCALGLRPRLPTALTSFATCCPLLEQTAIALRSSFQRAWPRVAAHVLKRRRTPLPSALACSLCVRWRPLHFPPLAACRAEAWSHQPKRRRTDIANPNSQIPRLPSPRAPGHEPRLLCRPIAPEFLGLHAVRTARKHGPSVTLDLSRQRSTRVFVDAGRRAPRQPVYHWIP